MQRAHYVVEALRRAYRDRGLFGDPDFVPSVLDNQGNAVAATLPVNLPFGSTFTVPGTGVVLNEEMGDFALDSKGSGISGPVSGQANTIGPGKRPLSSMSPSFIESPHAFTSFGTPGGSRIPSIVLLSMLQYLDDQFVTNWTSAPRSHYRDMTDAVEYEPGAFTNAQLSDLRERGYAVKEATRDFGNVQVVLWRKNNASVEAASDPRGVGVSAVFRAQAPLNPVRSCSDHSCLP